MSDAKAIARFIGMNFFREGAHLLNGIKVKRDIVLETAQADKDNAGPVLCGVMLGRVVGYKNKTVQQKDGSTTETVQLLGSFEATRAIDGEVATAGSAYMLPFFSNPIVETLEKGAKAVDFAVQISAVKNPGQGMPYMWVFHDLMKQVEVTPLDRIRAQMSPHALVKGSGEAETTKALPEPKSVLAEEMAPGSEPSPNNEQPLPEWINQAIEEDTGLPDDTEGAEEQEEPNKPATRRRRA